MTKPSHSSSAPSKTKNRQKRQRKKPAQTDLQQYGFEPTSAQQLQSKEFPPLRFAVDGFIAEGVTILAGKPKVGKSWMALDLGLAIASGRDAFGSVKCDHGHVLYLALEDNERRLQRRIQDLTGSGEVWPSKLELATVAQRLDEGLIEGIESWIVAHDPALIIIDTLAKVRPPTGGEGKYDADYAALAPLQKLAGETGVSILVVHHLRKMPGEDPFDMISGSTGLTGAVDAALILNRGSQGTTLYGRGREIEEIEKVVEFDRGKWRVLGDVDDVRRSAERKEIIEVLENSDEPLGPKEVAEELGKDPGNIKQLLFKMVKSGEVSKMGHGKYVSAATPSKQ